MIRKSLIFSPIIENMAHLFAKTLILSKNFIDTVLERSKGRDFYDLLFLLQMTNTNYDILAKKQGIHNYSELKDRLFNLLESVDIENKSKDMLHLLIDEKNRERIINFKRYFDNNSR